MDTRTPPIPLKHRNNKEQQENKYDRSGGAKRDKSPVNLPPLTRLSNNRAGIYCRWSSGPTVSRNNNCERHHGGPISRPYRVLEIGATPLMHACQQADVSRVSRLLREQEETIGYRDRALRSALHYCMNAGTGGAVASAAPELVNEPDAEGHTPLHLAVIAGDARFVAVLISNGADVNAKDSEGHGILHWATVCGEAECARQLLEAGARPSTPDLRGGSPLHYAAQCCGDASAAVNSSARRQQQQQQQQRLIVPKKLGLRILEILLEFGADVNGKDEDGRQPILWAASAGSVEALLALARAGGSGAAGATDKDGLTALHCAASRGHARCVEALVKLCGCNPDHVDDNGCSALHYAATLGHADATALLLRLGADPNRQDRKGRTPALCAAAKGQLETLRIVVQHGGCLDARTVRGTGIFHEAVISGRMELVEWLIIADKRTSRVTLPLLLDVATQDGKTPLHVAALHGHLDVCKLLIDNGARINAIFRTRKNGPMTALDAALYRGYRDCAKIIQMNGGTTARNLTNNPLKTINSSPAEPPPPSPLPAFAAKLGVKCEPYSEKQRQQRCWIESRRPRRRRGRSENLDNPVNGSFSEEEIVEKFSKLCPAAARRSERAKSESSARRYVDKSSSSSSTTTSTSNRHDDEYAGESWNETHRYSGNENKENFLQRGSSGSENDSTDSTIEPSLSDDSLEVVVVVKKTLEKTSEKVEISENKSKKPRETWRETSRRRVRKHRETTRRSRKKSKNHRSYIRADDDDDDDDGDDDEEKRWRKKKMKRRSSRVADKSKETDSTSQETGPERVTVTALVHKDQPPDTPRATAVSSDVASSIDVKAESKRDKDIIEEKVVMKNEISNERTSPRVIDNAIHQEPKSNVAEYTEDEERMRNDAHGKFESPETKAKVSAGQRMIIREDNESNGDDKSFDKPADYVDDNDDNDEANEMIELSGKKENETEDILEKFIETNNNNNNNNNNNGDDGGRESSQTRFVDESSGKKIADEDYRGAAIVAVIESPSSCSWHDEDKDSDQPDASQVFRVLPSTTSEEEQSTTASRISLVEKSSDMPVRRESSGGGGGGGRDSGIEPSPRVSKIPKRIIESRSKTQQHHHQQRALNNTDERTVETFNRAGMSGPALGVAKYDQPLTFRHFEAFLYEQLRRLQRRPSTPDFCTEARQCTRKTHRCHHATSAYTSIPVYTYLGGGGGGGGGGGEGAAAGDQEREQREHGIFPRIGAKGRITVTRAAAAGDEKRAIAAEKLDRTKNYYVTFTVSRAGEQRQQQERRANVESASSSVLLAAGIKESGNRNNTAKSV